MEQQPRYEYQQQHQIPELHPDHSGDGCEWMGRLPEVWHAHSSWGRGGWDLGNWPYSIVVLYDHPETNTFAHGTYMQESRVIQEELRYR